MIQKYVDRFIGAKDALRAELATNHPDSYDSLVKLVVRTVSNGDEYHEPCAERVHVIDDGDYQGTRLFIIAAGGYQPDTYWAIKVGYGSCSGCDTFQAIRDESGYGAEQATEKQIDQYMTLMLHMVQSMKEI